MKAMKAVNNQKKAATPALFGVKNSNRDFSKKYAWGKNNFNNSFPVSLACYMASKKIEPVYINLNEKLEVTHDKISVESVFGIDLLSEQAFYAFESIYTPYEIFVGGNLPRIDLVVNRMKKDATEPSRGLEIKLTALPDNSTFESSEDEYGSEIVVRPDTIVYLALSIIKTYKDERDKLLSFLKPLSDNISNWRRAESVLPHLDKACEAIDAVFLEKIDKETPLLIQPIWKTEGKKLLLAENCLDIFVWSNFAFTRLFIDSYRRNSSRTSVTRQMRSALWLVKMLYDFAKTGKAEPQLVIDEMTYDTKNDKAFASSGVVTRKYMKSPELTTPRITKAEIKNIILGGGEKFLSPERRFDAAVLSTPDLF